MRIVIIGCGYVGTALAKKWHPHHTLTLTTTTPDRVRELEPYADHVATVKGCEQEKIKKLLAGQDAVIITSAPKNQQDYAETYVETARSVRQASPVHQVIYTSSTSVYGDHHGNLVDEDTPLLAKTPATEALIQAEKALLDTPSPTAVCVLRLAGIYGPGRTLQQRAQRVAGKTLPGTGKEFSNHIHLEDIVSAIDWALHHRLEGIYNLCNDAHPTAQELYEQLCLQQSLPPLQWDATKASIHRGNKLVSNEKIKATGFTFAQPTLEK